MNATPHAFTGVVCVESAVLDGIALMEHGNRGPDKPFESLFQPRHWMSEVLHWQDYGARRDSLWS